MHFGSDDAGTPAVELVTEGGNGIVLPLADSGYHLFELTYDPVAESASLSIDGELSATGYEGVAHSSAPAVLWGAFTQNDTGHANFSFVQFAIGGLDVTDSAMSQVWVWALSGRLHAPRVGWEAGEAAGVSGLWEEDDDV